MDKLKYRAIVQTMPTEWLAINLKVPGKWQSNMALKIIAIELRRRGALFNIGLRSIPWEGR